MTCSDATEPPEQPEPLPTLADMSRTSLVFMLLVFYGSFLGLALFIGWWRSESLLAHPARLPESVALGCLCGFVVSLLCRLLVFLPLWRALVLELRALLGPLDLVSTAAMALASGLGEEALFRGALQPWLGLVPAAILFGCVHVPLKRTLQPWPFFAAAVGLLFGWLTVLTGTWVSAAMAHCVVNFINIRWMCSFGPSKVT